MWFLVKLIGSIALLLFAIWSSWYGVRIESGGLVIELYGIGRYFKK